MRRIFPVKPVVVAGCIALIWLFALTFVSIPDVHRTVVAESTACSESCMCRFVPQAHDVHIAFERCREVFTGWFDGLEGSNPWAGFEQQISEGVSSFVLSRISAAENLVLLALVRVHTLWQSLLLCAFICVASLVDALCMRHIAFYTFKSARPAVSLSGAFALAFCLCAALCAVFVPVAGAGSVFLCLAALVPVSLNIWVRFFHRL